MPRYDTQTITERELQEMTARFEEMAKKPKRVKFQDAVTRLTPVIQTMLEQGYSLQDVCAVMQEYGIKLTEGVLKKMLAEQASKNEGAEESNKPKVEEKVQAIEEPKSTSENGKPVQTSGEKLSRHIK